MTITAEQAAKLLEGTTPGPWVVNRGTKDAFGQATIYSIGPIKAQECAGAAWLGVPDKDARLIAAAPDLARALIASEAARKLAEERLAKAVEALRELAIHPEDNGDIMPGDFRDYYRDTCDFAAKALKEIDNG